MKKACLIVSLSALCLIFSALPAVALETAGPFLVMKERAVDFNEVKEGEVIEHVFKILNKGDRTLEIKKVQPG
jgi:hypothetical protein